MRAAVAAAAQQRLNCNHCGPQVPSHTTPAAARAWCLHQQTTAAGWQQPHRPTLNALPRLNRKCATPSFELLLSASTISAAAAWHTTGVRATGACTERERAIDGLREGGLCKCTAAAHSLPALTIRNAGAAAMPGRCSWVAGLPRLCREANIAAAAAAASGAPDVSGMNAHVECRLRIHAQQHPSKPGQQTLLSSMRCDNGHSKLSTSRPSG